mmetsp:Transcript_14888/g.44857  ORF Transcript_14888/g.44857 Transcript_14888/m.44857 type:complete len:246 (+) Transcript_14888:599-1336(+)
MHVALLVLRRQHLRELGEGPGEDEEHVPRADHGLALRPRGHEPRRAGRRARRDGDLPVLHELQQARLHVLGVHPRPGPGGGPAEGPARRGAADLVHLIHVDDAVLRGLDVARGHGHELLHDLVHVAAHVPRRAELGRVGLGEGDTDLLCQCADKVRLPRAGGAAEQDVRLNHRIGRPARLLPPLPELSAQVCAAPVVMVAERHAEHLLGIVLPDDVPVEVLLHLLRLEVEVQNALEALGDPPLRP